MYWFKPWRPPSSLPLAVMLKRTALRWGMLKPGESSSTECWSIHACELIERMLILVMIVFWHETGRNLGLAPFSRDFDAVKVSLQRSYRVNCTAYTNNITFFRMS